MGKEGVTSQAKADTTESSVYETHIPVLDGLLHRAEIAITWRINGLWHVQPIGRRIAKANGVPVTLTLLVEDSRFMLMPRSPAKLPAKLYFL